VALNKKKGRIWMSDFRIYLLMGKNIDELSTNRVMKQCDIEKKKDGHSSGK